MTHRRRSRKTTDITHPLIVHHKTSMSGEGEKSPCIPDIVPNPHPPLRLMKHGIYIVAYENPSPPSWTSNIRVWVEQYFVCFAHFSYSGRLLKEIFLLAPGVLFGYICATLWLSVSDALILLFWGHIFNFIEDYSTGTASRVSLDIAIKGGCFCAIFTPACNRFLADAKDTINTCLKVHFLPQLVESSMRVEKYSTQDCHTIFPGTGRGYFPSDIPGESFLQDLYHIIHTAVSLLSQMVVLMHTVLRKPSPEREVLFLFCIAHPLIRWLAPSNIAGVQGYIFYTSNVSFKRMRSLYDLAFSSHYREELVLNGAANSIPPEYLKANKQLGNEIVTEPFPWTSGLRRMWYWDLLINLTLDLPLAICALVLPYHPSPFSVLSIMLLQQAINALSRSIGEYGMKHASLKSLSLKAKRLYDIINFENKTNGSTPYPGLSQHGMTISFRQVSLCYGKTNKALDNVSLEIAAGQLVLLVGTNGSGKSSLLKLIARLCNPTEGDILIDGHPILTYNSDDVRGSMAFLPQLPVLFPMSVKENICLGLPPCMQITDEHIQVAAKMGGCTHWISRLQNGYDTQLKPTYDVGNGWAEGTYGIVSERLLTELERHRQQTITISDGEKQRLVAARTFMRINHSNIKLIAIDEGMSSLDAVTERDILSELHRLRRGKTMILVTHRFRHLVKEADQIICMKEGSVVEHGMHNQLMENGGEYAKLFNAQVSSA